VELEALNRRRLSDVQGMDAYEFSFGISEMLTSANRCKLARGDRTEVHPS
jgi:hypothetical protein